MDDLKEQEKTLTDKLTTKFTKEIDMLKIEKMTVLKKQFEDDLNNQKLNLQNKRKS